MMTRTGIFRVISTKPGFKEGMRTTEAQVSFLMGPEIGKNFKMLAEPLEQPPDAECERFRIGLRLISTGPVQTISSADGVTTIETDTSFYMIDERKEASDANRF